MNFLLKEEGFLDGEPGNYTITEKGKKFAEEHNHHRGTGGYSHYNRYWTTITWDDGIANELIITEDRKKEIRRAISIRKQKTNELENKGLTIECDSFSNEDADTTDANNDALVEAGSALLTAVLAWGFNKVNSHFKR